MCTLEKRGNLYILTLTGENEHRLNTPLLDSLQSALARIQSPHPSSALITTAQGKFFSNGYDLSWVKHQPSPKHAAQTLSSKLRTLVKALITLPIPTIAAVTGHASAAGLILALSHDYIVMRKDRGFMYMSELDIGMRISAWFLEVVRCKVGDVRAMRDLVLGAKKVTGVMAVRMGVVDEVAEGAAETVAMAVRLAVTVGRRERACGEMRGKLMKEVLEKAESDETVEDDDDDDDVVGRTEGGIVRSKSKL